MQAIEQAELVHRAGVGVLLDGFGAAPVWWRELVMGTVGLLFGFLCRFAGWFLPMYFAGRLEAMNVGQYEAAVSLARGLGLVDEAALLVEMVEEEARHEAFFADCVRGHWLLPVAGAVFGWRPAPAVSTSA